MRTPFPAEIVVLAAVTAAAAWFLNLRAGPPDTYWTIDNGGKALVINGLREDASRTWIPYAGAGIDPEHRWFPQPLGGAEPYGILKDGHVVSQYASAFTWAELPAARAAGSRGTAALPAAGAGLVVLFTGLLARARAGRRAGTVAALIIAAASPLVFYGAVLWEHTLVVAFAAAAFVLLRTGRPLLAGLAVGAAGLFREELFLLAVAAGLALLIARRIGEAGRFLAGTAVLGILTLAFQKATTGAWTGVHVAVNRPVPFANFGEAVSGLLFSGGPGMTGWWAVAALALLAAGRRASAPGARAGLQTAGLAALAVISGLALARFPGGEDAALALLRSNSAALFLPWAMAAFLLKPRDGAAPLDLLSLTALLFVFLFCVLVPQRSITGVHPGPRMLLPVLPVAAALAAERRPHGRLAEVAFLALLVAGALWGARAAELLAAKRTHAGGIAAALREDPRRIVATDQFWLPTEMAALWGEKQFHLITGPPDLQRLAAAVSAGGAAGGGGAPGDSGAAPARAASPREILLVTAPGSSPSAPLRSVRSDRFPAFSVDFHVVPLGGSPTAAP